jgi:pilus assembly protein CpaB
MPRIPGWALLIVAFGCATLATFMVKGYIDRAAKPVKAKIQVVRTIDKVEKGEILSAKQLKKVDLTEETIPQDRDYFSDEKKAEGRKALESLPANTLITAKNTERVIPGMAGKVEHNWRAMTVKVDEASGVAGFLAPENRVDVLVVLDKGEFNKNPISKTLLQNLKVLGTGQKTVQNPEDKPQIVPTVTLEVTPEQGEILALAAQQGRISLVLRGQLPKEPPGAEASTSNPAVPGTTALLNPNQRVVHITVSDASVVAPGNRVDVVLFMDKGEWSKYPIAKILFQNMEVLNTDRRQQVTLAVTPQEALDLTWAAQVGRISLLMRPGDKTVGTNENMGKTVGVDAGRFFGKWTPPSVPRTMIVIRGIEWALEEPLNNK